MRIKWILWPLGIGLAVGAYLSVVTTIRERAEALLTSALGLPVTVQMAQLTFPLGVHLAGIRVPAGPGQGGGSLFSLQEMSAALSVNSFLMGRPGVDLAFTAPRFTLERYRQNLFSISLASLSSGLNPSGPTGLVLNRLQVRDGQLTLVDRAVTPEVFWNLRNLAVSMRAGERPGAYPYTVLSVLEDAPHQEIGRLEINGEFFLGGTGEAAVTMEHRAIQRLAPYIRPVLGVAPNRGSCLVKAKITTHEGVCVAEVDLTASGLAFRTEEATVLGPSGSRLVELLQDPDRQIHLSFVVKGRLGERLDWSDLVASTFTEAMKQALARSIQRTLSETEVKKPVEELLRKGYESLGK
ncbi:MAG: DUF748 domain-containing protein [Candidatus Omnitrophica bacterium]|nr:DUF748 domain-containing protein [Candidatus Omnitrophota bacterium]